MNFIGSEEHKFCKLPTYIQTFINFFFYKNQFTRIFDVKCYIVFEGIMCPGSMYVTYTSEFVDLRDYVDRFAKMFVQISKV